MPCTQAFLLHLGAVKLRLHFGQNGVLGVVEVAQQLTARRAGVAAAAQTPRDGAGVHALGGAHADAVAAAGLLAERSGPPSTPSMLMGRLVSSSRSAGSTPLCSNLVAGEVHQGAAAVQMIFQMVAGDALGLHSLAGAFGCRTEQGVQLFQLRARQNEPRRHKVGVGRGVDEKRKQPVSVARPV